jgi:hypothetical protein
VARAAGWREEEERRGGRLAGRKGERGRGESRRRRRSRRLIEKAMRRSRAPRFGSADAALKR